MGENNLIDLIGGLIDQIAQLPDEALTDEALENIKNNVLDNLDEVERKKAILNMREEIRLQPREARDEMLNGYDELVNELIDGMKDELSAPKLEIMHVLFDSVCELLKEAMKGDTTVHFQLVHPNAKVPTYAHDTDAGADIYLPEDIAIPAYARGFMVKTGLKMAMEAGWMMDVRPRSGLSHKTTMRISNSVGTIDAGYRGEVGVLVDNLSDEPIVLKAGDRIAQFVLHPVYQFNAEVVDDVEAIGEDRGGGFGSTNK